jgi:hypothetical protein
MPAMSRLRRRSGGPALVVALVLLLIAAACGGNPAPSATPTAPPTAAPTSTPAPTEAPSGSPDASPGGDDAAVYEEIEQQVIALRGLQPTEAVAREVMDEAELRAWLLDSFSRDNPEAYVRAYETLYKSLQLLPQDASLKDLIVELYATQAAGVYDDKSKQMIVVSKTGELGPVERITYAHEYVHALQDQAYDIKGVLGDAKDESDRSLARTAIFEGDAYLTMSLWAQANLTAAELGQVATAADPASAAALEKLPEIVKQQLLFPAITGITQAIGDFTRGGFAAIEGRFASPPDSTEQLLHPEKLAAGEKPVEVAFPDDLAARLGTGWTVALQDTFGEAQLEILLRDAGGVPSSQSKDAAAGWGGDRVALVQGPGGATGVVIDAAWDTDADAREYASALTSLAGALQAAGRSAQVLTPAPDRVVLVTGESADTVGRLANALGLAG